MSTLLGLAAVGVRLVAVAFIIGMIAAPLIVQVGGAGRMRGLGPHRYSPSRTAARISTHSPKAKCEAFSDSRRSIPFGKNTRSSIHAYTATIRSDVVQ